MAVSKKPGKDNSGEYIYKKMKKEILSLTIKAEEF